MQDDQPQNTNVAILDWDANGEPISKYFNDVYFAQHEGLAETRYVFLQQNKLPERFAALSANDVFVIGETGFGTGLNFLATWELWQCSACSGAELHFISAEKYPLQHEDLARALALWPQLEPFAAQLLSAYPPVFNAESNLGYFRLSFAANVHLTLIFADAACAFGQFLPENLGENLLAQQQQLHMGGWQLKVDAWFLDGFAPSKNPSMWRDELFIALANLSHPQTTLATFTAAAVVKKGLAQAGFSWQKQAGFGRKRDMLTAVCLPFSRYGKTARRRGNHWHLTAAARSTGKNVLVVGAGIAGCQCAWMLALRGFNVTLAERGEVACGGSGNPQGIVYTTLSHTPGPFADINLAAFLFACQFYHAHGWFQAAGAQIGLIDLMADTDAMAQLSARFAGNQHWVQALNSEQAAQLAGVAVERGGLFYPQAGWLNPGLMCRLMAAQPGICLLENSAITQLNYQQQQWHTDVGAFDQVVLAAAADCVEFVSAKCLRIKPIRGQITTVKPAGNLQRVLCGEGYIAPAHNGVMSTGASFNPKSASTAILDADRQQNLHNAALLAAEFARLEPTGDRAGLRCVTPDYLPAVGPLPQPEFVQQFAALKVNRNAPVDAPAAYYPQLFCITGLGSRGLTYSPIAAALITALLTGAPLPLSVEQWKFIHPARFWLRDLIRGIDPAVMHLDTGA